MTWHVERVAVELLEDGDEAYLGINQTQAGGGSKMADGAFYAELWTEDRQTRLTQDLDRGLPPLGSYEPHLVTAAKMPGEALLVRCYFESEDSATWHPVAPPDEGWAGRMVQVSWAEGS